MGTERADKRLLRRPVITWIGVCGAYGLAAAWKQAPAKHAPDFRLACNAHEDVTYAPTMFVSKLLATHLADEGVERCGFYKLDSGWGGVGGS